MVQKQQLTEDQDIILEYIAGQIEDNKKSPTFGEASDFTGFPVSKIQRTVDKCVRLKLLKREPLIKSGLKLGTAYKEYSEQKETP